MMALHILLQIAEFTEPELGHYYQPSKELVKQAREELEQLIKNQK